MKEEPSEQPQKLHNITIENREHALISGVEKVVSANETSLLLKTGKGGLSITGSNLKINKFDIDSGTLCFTGTVNIIRYSGAKVPLIKRIFS